MLGTEGTTGLYRAWVKQTRQVIRWSWCQPRSMLLHTGALLLVCSDCIAESTKGHRAWLFLCHQLHLTRPVSLPVGIQSVDPVAASPGHEQLLLLCALHTVEPSEPHTHPLALRSWWKAPGCSRHMLRGFNLSISGRLGKQTGIGYDVWPHAHSASVLQPSD